ncbi:hypothetical protein [Streptomyces rubellomurinus]|uniref:Uncharacterized protein n=1 Tax=Streptomyces sp. Y1 TaxID=3238634 RepID=A0AB39TW17_9ACTN|nr:hypothetical protein [Streptomyces rubellomurinus]
MRSEGPCRSPGPPERPWSEAVTAYRLLGLDLPVPPVHHALTEPDAVLAALKTAFA